VSGEPAWLVELLDWATASPLARPIREAVFIREQGVPVELEWDEEDPRCLHAVARSSDGTPVGTARLKPDGTLGRMAVLKKWRRRGIGSTLLGALVAEARRRGLAFVRLSAQTHALAFYGKRGFTVTSDVYLDAGIPHRAMILDLTDV